MLFAHGCTITVHRSGGTDRYGNPLPGTNHEVPGCAVAPSGSSEVTGGQATVLDKDTVYAPYDADVQPHDEIEIPPGQPLAPGRYQVEGTPARWKSPFTGREFGTVIQLTQAEG
jgi:hypothetical protein